MHTSMSTCKTCKYFAPGGKFDHVGSAFTATRSRLTINRTHHTGFCLCPKVHDCFVSQWTGRRLPSVPQSDEVLASADDDRGTLYVGKDFGCIHHQSGEMLDDQEFQRR
jgi:hypothetical protein